MSEKTIPFEAFKEIFDKFVSDVQNRLDIVNGKLEYLLKTPLEKGEEGLPGAPGKRGDPGKKGATGDPGNSKSKDKNGFTRNSHAFEATATGAAAAATAVSVSVTGASFDFHGANIYGNSVYQELNGVRNGLFGGKVDQNAINAEVGTLNNQIDAANNVAIALRKLAAAAKIENDKIRNKGPDPEFIN